MKEYISLLSIYDDLEELAEEVGSTMDSESQESLTEFREVMAKYFQKKVSELR